MNNAEEIGMVKKETIEYHGNKVVKHRKVTHRPLVDGRRWNDGIDWHSVTEGHEYSEEGKHEGSYVTQKVNGLTAVDKDHRSETGARAHAAELVEKTEAKSREKERKGKKSRKEGLRGTVHLLRPPSDVNE